MSAGKLNARHYATGEAVAVEWHAGVITRITPTDTTPEGWVAPAIFDPQVNGYGGVDFQRDEVTEGDLRQAVDALHRDGCGRILLTLVTDEWPRLLNRLRRLKSLREGAADLRHAIAGWHIEGPFLSREAGFHGAHNPAVMLDPTPALMEELRAVVPGDPLLVTLAPERPGAIEAIRHAVSLGIKISLGHTDAPAELIQAAVTAGASGFTHLGNACPPQLGRHDNIIVRALDAGGLTVSLIPDGLHVPPPLFRLFHRALAGRDFFYTTDAMAAAGAGPGRYTIGAIELEVGADEVVRQPGRPNFAGSALRPIDGVRRAARMLGRPWQTLWAGFSEQPARFMGLAGGLKVGQPADLCLIQQDGAGELVSARVFTRGESA